MYSSKKNISYNCKTMNQTSKVIKNISEMSEKQQAISVELKGVVSNLDYKKG